MENNKPSSEAPFVAMLVEFKGFCVERHWFDTIIQSCNTIHYSLLLRSGQSSDRWKGANYRGLWTVPETGGRVKVRSGNVRHIVQKLDV